MKNYSIAIAALTLAACSTDNAPRVHVPYHATVPMVAPGTLRISQDAGTFHVIAWNQPRVQIDADRYANSLDDANAITISEQRDGNDVTISTEHETHFAGKESGVNYIIHAPASARLDVNENAGTIEATGFTSDVNAAVTAGEIGIIMAKMSAPESVAAAVTTGEVTVHLPSSGAASIRMAVMLGDKTNTYVNAKGVAPGSVNASVMLGDVRVEPTVQ